MDVPFNAEVECVDGVCGRSTHVILNPEKKEITHLVVKDGLLGEERLVPMEMAFDSTTTTIRLRCAKSEVKEMSPFVRNEYIPQINPAGRGTGSDFLLMPNMAMPQRTITVSHEEVPEGEVALKRGVSVRALDGPIGRVGEFMIDPRTGNITHLVLEEGHFWDKKHITIPVSEVDHIEDDAVYLRITKDIVEALPMH